MTKKIKTVIIFTFLNLLILFKTTPVMAVTNQFHKYDLSYYQSVVKPDGGWFGWVDNGITNMMNSITNFLFGMNKIIWQGFDMVIKYAYKADIFNDYADMIGKVAKTMYDNLFSSAGMLFFLIVIIGCGITFIKVSPEKALRQFGVSALVIVLTGVWFNQSGYYMKVLNGLTNELQADISSAGTISGDKLVNNGKKDSISSASENLRSNYFQMSVEEPFYLMNYGTTDNDAIKKETHDGKSIDEFLAKKVSKDAADSVKENMDAVDYDKNQYLSPDQLPYKMTIATSTILDTIGFGLIEVIIAILSVVIQFLAVLIDLILPIFAILSIFPRFNNLFYGGVKGMAMVLLAKASLGLVMLSFRLILLFVDGLIPRSSVAGFVGNNLFKLLMILVIYLFRRPLGSLMKTMVGTGINKFKNEAVPEPINNVLPKLKAESSNDYQDQELDMSAFDNLNKSMDKLTDAIKGNPDSIDEQKPEDIDMNDKEDVDEIEDKDTPDNDEIEPVDDLDEVNEEQLDPDDPSIDDYSDEVNNNPELTDPDTIKSEMLEDESIPQDDQSKITNMEEYQNLTALNLNYENTGFESLQENEPINLEEQDNFETRLAEVE